MERSQFFNFILLGLAVGVCIEVLKVPLHSQSSLKLATYDKFETLLDEGRTLPRKVEEPAPRIAVNLRGADTDVEDDDAENQTDNDLAKENGDSSAPEPPALVVAPTPEAPKPQGAAPGVDANANKKAERAAKRAELKKAIGEKLEYANAAFAHQSETVRKLAEERDELAKANELAVAAGGAVMASPAPTAQSNNDGSGPSKKEAKIPQTAREWEALLLKEPNAGLTQQFVGHFRSGQVRSDVFFSVMRQMSEESRPQLRELGIKTLAGVKHPQSFAILARISSTEHETQIKTDIEAALQEYAKVENLQQLMGVLQLHEQIADSQVTLTAMELLRSSAETHLRASPSGTDTTTSSSAGTPPQSPAAVANSFSPFVHVLQDLAQKNPGSSINQNATQTLAELQTLLTAVQPNPSDAQQVSSAT